MGQYTMDEYKTLVAKQIQIEANFKTLILKLDGSIGEDGSITTGLLQQLEKLYARLNPESIVFLGNLAREKAIESLKQIELMLSKQDVHYQDRFLQLEIFFENQKKDFDKKTFEIIKSLREETKTKVHELTANETNQFFNRLDVQTIDLFTKLEEFNKKRDTNYLYIIIATVVGIGLGFVLGIKF